MIHDDDDDVDDDDDDISEYPMKTTPCTITEHSKLYCREISCTPDRLVKLKLETGKRNAFFSFEFLCCYN